MAIYYKDQAGKLMTIFDDAALAEGGKVKSVNGKTGDVVIPEYKLPSASSSTIGGVLVKSTANESYPLTVPSVGTLDNLKIGGRNLLTGTKDFSGWQYTTKWETDSTQYDKLTVLKRKEKFYPLTQQVYLDDNETYTFGFFARVDLPADEKVIVYVDGQNDPNTCVTDITATPIDVTTTWRRFFVKFKTTKGGISYPRVTKNDSQATLYVAGFKLEKGDIPTDWTPAPEDLAMASDIETVKSQITPLQGQMDGKQDKIKIVTTDPTADSTKSDPDGTIYLKI